jgi:hypothetical protein
VGAPVQSTTAQCAGATSISATLNGVSAGNTLIFTASYNDTWGATTPNQPTDSNGTVSDALRPNAVVVNGLAIGAMVCYVPNCAAGTHTFTLAGMDGSANATLYCSVALVEEAGILTASPVDVAAGPGTSYGAGTTTGNISSGALAQANEFIVAAVAVGAGTGLTNAGITNPTGFTQLIAAQNTSSSNGAQICWKEVTSTSSVTATWTWTACADQYGTEELLVSFKETGGGSQSFSYTASGGVSFGGHAAALRTRAKFAVGGLTLGGASTTVRRRVTLPVGGIQFAGAAAVARVAHVQAQGGITFGGAAAQARIAGRSTNGGLTLAGSAGSAFHESTRTVQASGGLTFGGSAQAQFVNAGGGIGHLIRRHWRRQRRPWPRDHTLF